MLRPKRSAAERAKLLIAAGYGPLQVGNRQSSGLSAEEEDFLDENLVGMHQYEEQAGRSGLLDNIPQQGPSGASKTWNSYDDQDVVPGSLTFQPKRPAGLHLPQMITRLGDPYTKAIDFFQLFFTDEVLDIICENTNTYALLHILDKPTYGRSEDGAWENLTVPELKAFLGLIIMMGFINLPDIARYWCTKSLYHGGWARRFMSRNRFKALLAFLHVSAPEAEDPADKLSKLRPLIDHIRTTCAAVYQPDRCISIDERMVKSKGRSGIRQYMPLKPVRFGYKLWCCCESTTGYTLNFDVYTGKRQKPGPHGLAYDVVTGLMSQYLQQGYLLYYDNFYSSVTLSQHLWEQQVGVCCTTLTTRKGFPYELKETSWQKHAKRGDMRWLRRGQIMFLQWMDTRMVNMTSTFHAANESCLVKRNLKDPKGNYRPVMVRKPRSIMDYNKQMGGVDLSDQLIQPYNVLLKSHRWWKTLFFHLVDVVIVNSHILFKQWVSLHPENHLLVRPAGYSQLEFREELVRQLANISETESIPQVTMTPKDHAHSVYHTSHIPEHTPRRHNCKVCYALTSKEIRTQWWCMHEACNVPLCLTAQRNCFKTWHAPAFDETRDAIRASCRNVPPSTSSGDADRVLSAADDEMECRDPEQ